MEGERRGEVVVVEGEGGRYNEGFFFIKLMLLPFQFSTHAAQCSIEYEDKAVQYQNEVLLLCLLPVPVKWWRSTERCGDFVDHSSQCGSTSCTVHTNSSYFYYCCTPSTVSDVLVARDDERRCFRIQGWCSFWTVAS